MNKPTNRTIFLKKNRTMLVLIHLELAPPNLDRDRP